MRRDESLGLGQSATVASFGIEPATVARWTREARQVGGQPPKSLVSLRIIVTVSTYDASIYNPSDPSSWLALGCRAKPSRPCLSESLLWRAAPQKGMGVLPEAAPGLLGFPKASVMRRVSLDGGKW